MSLNEQQTANIVNAAVEHALEALQDPTLTWSAAAGNAHRNAVAAASSTSPEALTSEEITAIKAGINNRLGDARAAQLAEQRRIEAAEREGRREDEERQDAQTKREQWQRLTHSIF